MIDNETGEIRNEKGKLYAALAKAQGEFKPVGIDKKVDFTTKQGRRVKYNYASFAAIFNMAHKALAQNELCVIQSTINGQLITTLAHSSGQETSSSVTLQENSDPKVYAANLSYMRRYQYTAICGIVIVDEDDENIVESAQQRSAQSQNGSSSKKERPLSPIDLKQAAAVKTAKFTSLPNEKQLQYAVSSLDKASGNDEPLRHKIGAFLFGKPSSKEWTSGECSFVIDWIGANKANDYTPTEDAMKEVALIQELSLDVEDNILNDEIPF